VPLPRELLEGEGALAHLSREDIAAAEAAAKDVAKMAFFEVHARQPFDTVSKVVKARQVRRL